MKPFESLLLLLCFACWHAARAQDFVLDQTLEYTGSCDGDEISGACTIKEGGGRYGGWDTTNIQTCGDLDEEGDELAMLYDVQYSGKLTWYYGPSASGNCPEQSNTSTYDYTFYIGNVGDIPGTTIARSMWDDNPYFMALDYITNMTRSEGNGIDTWGTARFRSSTSYYVYSRPWTVEATRMSDGSGYTISGELDNLRYDGLNDMSYKYMCDRGFWGGWDWESEYLIKGCNTAGVLMSGTVTAERAEVTFDISETLDGTSVNRRFEFAGERTGGAELVLDGDVPAATGAAEDADDVLVRSPFYDGGGTSDGNSGSGSGSASGSASGSGSDSGSGSGSDPMSASRALHPALALSIIAVVAGGILY